MSVNRFANLIIAGVNKGGTTSLFSYLATHPDICASSVKETCFFLPLRYGEQPQELREYAEFFSQSSGQRYRMESTPGYFYGGPPLIDALSKLPDQPRILIVLRNPVDRMFSFYRFMKNMLVLDQNTVFEDYLDRCQALSIEDKILRENNAYWGLDGGFYPNYLEQWHDRFGDRLKICFFDDLRRDPSKLLRSICEWLEIDTACYSEGREFSVENRTIAFKNRWLHETALWANKRGERMLRRYPRLKRWLRILYGSVNRKRNTETLSDETRARLTNIFADSNARLREFVTRLGYTNLPKWLNDEGGANTHQKDTPK